MTDRDEPRIDIKSFKGPDGEDRPVLEIAVSPAKFDLMKHVVKSPAKQDPKSPARS